MSTTMDMYVIEYGDTDYIVKNILFAHLSYAFPIYDTSFLYIPMRLYDCTSILYKFASLTFFID